MPITYRFIEESNAFLVTCTGTVTDMEFIEHRKELEADQRLQVGYQLLVDLRKVAAIDISVDTFKMDAKNVKSSPRHSHSRIAIVAPKEAVFGLARIYQVLNEEGPRKVMVFHTMAEAEQWLGVSVESGHR
jgi:hypothetical protein